VLELKVEQLGPWKLIAIRFLDQLWLRSVDCVASRKELHAGFHKFYGV
jgi:hypothetical protein